MIEAFKVNTEEKEKELTEIMKARMGQQPSNSHSLEDALEKIIDSLQRIEGLIVVASQSR